MALDLVSRQESGLCDTLEEALVESWIIKRFAEREHCPRAWYDALERGAYGSAGFIWQRTDCNLCPDTPIAQTRANHDTSRGLALLDRESQVLQRSDS